jgi:hypothetical protein
MSNGTPGKEMTELLKLGSEELKREGESGNKLSKQDLLKLFPGQTFSKPLMDIINNESDDMLRYAYIQNLKSMSTVYQQLDVTIMDFMHAAKFATHILTGESTEGAFRRVFPMQYQAIMKTGISTAEMLKKVKTYRNTQLVTSLLEQAMVPVHLMYQDIFHKAIQSQALLMRTADSEMVRMKAAECLINNLKTPEQHKVELAVVHKSTVIDELKNVTRDLAVQQKKMIEAGMSVKDMAEADIIDITPVAEPEKVKEKVPVTPKQQVG